MEEKIYTKNDTRNDKSSKKGRNNRSQLCLKNKEYWENLCSKHSDKISWRQDVIDAKEEIEILLNFGTFEEIEDIGWEFIMSKCIIVQKQAHDGQRRNVKARIKAWG